MMFYIKICDFRFEKMREYTTIRVYFAISKINKNINIVNNIVVYNMDIEYEYYEIICLLAATLCL